MAGQNKLSHSKCAKATVAEGKKRRTLTDGLGLKLNITATSKLWRFDYTRQGKQRSLSLGKFPEVSLAEARTHRETAREHLRAGRDPVAARKAESKGIPLDTFAAVAKAFIESKNQWTEGHRRTVRQRLDIYIEPDLGSHPVS